VSAPCPQAAWRRQDIRPAHMRFRGLTSQEHRAEQPSSHEAANRSFAPRNAAGTPIAAGVLYPASACCYRRSSRRFSGRGRERAAAADMLAPHHRPLVPGKHPCDEVHDQDASGAYDNMQHDAAIKLNQAPPSRIWRYRTFIEIQDPDAFWSGWLNCCA
jgi:hypothetical protein